MASEYLAHALAAAGVRRMGLDALESDEHTLVKKAFKDILPDRMLILTM